MKSIDFSDEELLVMLREGGQERQSALDYIYRKTELNVLKFVRLSRNQWSLWDNAKTEALDLASEAIVLFLTYILSDKFEGKSALTTYFIGICKFLWLNRIKKEGNRRKLMADYLPTIDTEIQAFVLAHLETEETRQYVHKILGEIDEKCQKLLRLRFFEDKTFKEIAQLLDYSSEQVAIVSMDRCKQKIRKSYQDL